MLRPCVLQVLGRFFRDPRTTVPFSFRRLHAFGQQKLTPESTLEPNEESEHHHTNDDKQFLKDLSQAHSLFDGAYNDIESRYGLENLRFPQKFIWLTGAPGSGKGTITPLILRICGLEPIHRFEMSSILRSDEAQKIKGTPKLVDDKEVVRSLFHYLLRPELQSGVLIDGFPRTRVQTITLKLLYKKMLELHQQNAKLNFCRPNFRIMVLYVDEETSVERQLRRGREMLDRNEAIRAGGADVPLLDVRTTDLDPAQARQRFRVYEENTLAAVESLGPYFAYDVVNAMGTIVQVEANIRQELEFAALRDLEHERFRRVLWTQFAELYIDGWKRGLRPDSGPSRPSWTGSGM